MKEKIVSQSKSIITIFIAIGLFVAFVYLSNNSFNADMEELDNKNKALNLIQDKLGTITSSKEYARVLFQYDDRLESEPSVIEYNVTNKGASSVSVKPGQIDKILNCIKNNNCVGIEKGTLEYNIVNVLEHIITDDEIVAYGLLMEDSGEVYSSVFVIKNGTFIEIRNPIKSQMQQKYIEFIQNIKNSNPNLSQEEIMLEVRNKFEQEISQQKDPMLLSDLAILEKVADSVEIVKY